MNLAYFTSLSEIVTDDNWETVVWEVKNYHPISYWSDHVPDLYLLLIGNQYTLKPWAAFEDDNYPDIFYTKAEIVFNQLERLIALAKTNEQFAITLLKLLEVKTILEANMREYFFLYHSEVLFAKIERNYKSKVYKEFHHRTIERISVLNNELNESEKVGFIPEKHKSLFNFFNNSETKIGFWHNDIAYNHWCLDVNYNNYETPEFLTIEPDKYLDISYHNRLKAYEVRIKTGTTVEDFTTGIVTQSEHWIIPLGKYKYINTNDYDEGYSKSWIIAHTEYNIHNDHNSPWRNTCYLLDANGKLALDDVYEKLYTMGNWALARSVEEFKNGEGARLINLETQEILPYRIEDAQLFDDLIVADLVITKQEREKLDENYKWTRNKTGALDLNGNLVIPFEYESIDKFDKKHKLAIVQKNEEYGLIDKKGKIVVPINYYSIIQKPSGIPSIYKESIIFTQKTNITNDGFDLVYGIANIKGEIILEPIYILDYTLNHDFNKEGELMVSDANDNELKLLYDGTIIDLGYKYSDRLNAVREQMNIKINKSTMQIPLSDIKDKFSELLQLVTRNESSNDDIETCINQFIMIHEDPENYISECIDEDEQDDFFAEDTNELIYHLIYYFLVDKDLLGNSDWKFDPEDLEMFITTLSRNEFTFSYPEGSVSHELFPYANEALKAKNLELINLNSNGDNYGFVVVNKDDVSRVLHLSQELDIPFEQLT